MNGNDDFGRLFREVQEKFSRLYTRLLHNVDLTLPQFTLLNMLAIGGPIPMSAASAKMHISKPAVTKLADRLEARKMLARTAHPSDRRSVLLVLRPEGEKAVQEVRNRTIDRLLLKTLDSFPAAEKQQVRRFFETLSVKIEDGLSETEGPRTS